LGRPGAVLAAALLVLLAGCGGGDSAVTAACDDAAFRAQDEELYVTETAASNALAGAGEAETLLRDVRRARTALGDYLAAQPPCDEALRRVAATEAGTLESLDDVLASLEQGDDADADLQAAVDALTEAQGVLTGTG
jgi:hypothetical protein